MINPVPPSFSPSSLPSFPGPNVQGQHRSLHGLLPPSKSQRPMGRCLPLVVGMWWLMGFGSLGCHLSSTPSQVVAWMGREPLSVQAFLQRWQQEKIAPIAGTSWERETLAAQRYALLNTMVAEHLWLQAAARKGIVIAQSQVDGMVARSQQGYTPQEWEAALKAAHHTRGSWQDHLQKTAIIQAYLQQEIYGRVVVYDEDIDRAMVESQRAHPTGRESIHLHAVQVDRLELAEQIVTDLRQGVAWAEVWRKYQLAGLGPTNGNYGMVYTDELPQALLPCLQKPALTVSYVQKSDQEFYVCQILERKGAQPLAGRALRAQVEKQLRLEAERNAQVAHLQRLWEEAPVRLMEEHLSVAH